MMEVKEYEVAAEKGGNREEKDKEQREEEWLYTGVTSLKN